MLRNGAQGVKDKQVLELQNNMIEHKNLQKNVMERTEMQQKIVGKGTFYMHK